MDTQTHMQTDTQTHTYTDTGRGRNMGFNTGPKRQYT